MHKYINSKLQDYNINLVNRPETYKTILKRDFGQNTETTKLRKKLSKLIKEGHITNIPIKNFFRGRSMVFYISDKTYYIVFANNDCYYCKNINYDDKYVYMVDTFKLSNEDWVSIKNKKLNLSEVILCL